MIGIEVAPKIHFPAVGITLCGSCGAMVADDALVCTCGLGFVADLAGESGGQ